MRPEHWLYTIPLRLRSLLRGARADQELDDELRDHLERKTEEYLAKGMMPQEARRRARLDLGGIEQTKEKCRDTRGVNWIQDFVQDLRYGLRMLRKSSGFATVAVLTLALGIGFNTAIFSLLNALTRPLNVPEPDRLVRLFSGPLGASYVMSYPNYVDLRLSAQSFSQLAVYSFPQPMSLSAVSHKVETTSERVWGIVVSGNYFETLGVSAALGRTFAPDEDRTPDSRPVVVISHRLWRERFNENQNVIGLKVKLNGYPFEVIGVADRMLQAGLQLSSVSCLENHVHQHPRPQHGWLLLWRPRRGGVLLDGASALQPESGALSTDRALRSF